MTTTAELGDRVHYVSQGSPIADDGTQVYPSTCRVADVIDLPPQIPEYPQHVTLFVINPTGFHFNADAVYDPGFAPGTWHFKCDHDTAGV